MKAPLTQLYRGFLFALLMTVMMAANSGHAVTLGSSPNQDPILYNAGSGAINGNFNFGQGQGHHHRHHGGMGGFGGGQQPSDAQKQAMLACMQQQGFSMPNPPSRPQLTAQQETAIQTCQQQSAQGDRSQFEQCIANQGVTLPTPPAPPAFDNNQMQAMRTCRQQVMGQQ